MNDPVNPHLTSHTSTPATQHSELGTRNSELATPRLILRDFIPGDWPAISALLADPTATRYMHFATMTEEQRRHWFDWCIANSRQLNHDADNWCITLKASGDPIGWFGIGAAEIPHVPGERSFGYIISPQFWNRGFMTEALQAIIAHEFLTLGSPRLRATCETANLASARVMEKAGLRHQQTVYDADFLGNWAHRHHYAIEKQDYLSN